jgi:hypothetical protein
MLIRPLVFYRCQSWVLKQIDEGKLSILERRILRKIYGPTCVNGVWRIKFDDNDDVLCSFHKEPSRVKIEEAEEKEEEEGEKEKGEEEEKMHRCSRG